MAKKKQIRPKKTAKKPVAKKPAPSKSKAQPKAAAKPKSRGTSVDSLLKKFERERKTQEAKLASSRKKIDEMEKKAAQLREQIAEAKELAKTTQSEIDQLDSRRDSEVSEVLAKLGVQLSTGRAAPEPRPVLTLGQKPTEPNDDSDD